LVAFADRQPGALSLPEVVEAVLARTWRAAPEAEARNRSLRRVTERVALDAMMILGAHADTTPEARAYVLDQIAKLGESLRTRKDENPLTEAHYRQAERDHALPGRSGGQRPRRCRGAAGHGRAIHCHRAPRSGDAAFARQPDTRVAD
jgi:hypothetical protein